MGEGNMGDRGKQEDPQGLVPEIMPEVQPRVHPVPIDRERMAMRRTVIKGVTVAGLVVFSGWLFQVFAQQRGWVSLFDSRITLAFFGVAGFVILWLLTDDRLKEWKRLYRIACRIGLGMCVILVCLGLDRWAPKPRTLAPQLSLKCRSTPIPVADFPGSPSTTIIDPKLDLSVAWGSGLWDLLAATL